jgi:hypothetical protein
MSDKPTYMDCWHFIAPLIPVDTDYTMDIYIKNGTTERR